MAERFLDLRKRRIVVDGVAGVGMPQPMRTHGRFDPGGRTSGAPHDVMHAALGESAALAAHEQGLAGTGVAAQG